MLLLQCICVKRIINIIFNLYIYSHNASTMSWCNKLYSIYYALTATALSCTVWWVVPMTIKEPTNRLSWKLPHPLCHSSFVFPFIYLSLIFFPLTFRLLPPLRDNNSNHLILLSSLHHLHLTPSFLLSLVSSLRNNNRDHFIIMSRLQSLLKWYASPNSLSRVMTGCVPFMKHLYMIQFDWRSTKL